jgi:DNA-binding transcriptional ArsR family regulator
MEDKVVLDKEVFKALSVETRINILKLLTERRYILSELSESLGMSNSTIKEHLDIMVKAGLIKQIDSGHKWNYYKLTFKGKNVVNPQEVKVFFAFIISTIVAMGATTYMFSEHIIGLFPTKLTKDVAPEMMTMASRAISETTSQTQSINMVALIILIISGFIMGLSLGYYLKKKAIILKVEK